VFRLLKQVWIPLLLVVVVVIGTYAVVRVRDLFGAEGTAAAADGNGDETKPFNPKHITYEITGPPGASSTSTIWTQTANPIVSTPPPCRGRTPS